MSISEEARELLAKEQQKSKKTQENILERSEEEIKEGTEGVVSEKSRELLAETRQHLKQTHENMLERVEEEIQE